ncbi:hypothetical protein F2Q70_00006156 [Brassica cretica]|uniref:Uncharacterized protein n=1 Tax=Brassica cretica TaxID=69181 RepID=A0A8S9IVQ7_BRACR|nr:hypothetical protein F2Q70_00006156 [Brassica cretica]
MHVSGYDWMYHIWNLVDQSMNTATRVNGILVATFKLTTLGFVAWMASITYRLVAPEIKLILVREFRQFICWAMAQIQGSDPYPVAIWINWLGDLGRQALHLLHPVVCSAMACFGVTAIAVSPTFRTLGTRVQVVVLSGLGMYADLTGCIAFRTWTTNRAVNTGNSVNRDYPLALGARTLAIQSQYMFHHQGYNLASCNIVVGLFSIGAMVVIREFDTVILGMLMLVIAALLYSCN